MSPATISDRMTQLYSQGRLRIEELVLCSKCLLGCGHCGLDAKGNGPMMPWRLLESLVRSEQLAFTRSDPVLLGDAEVLLYKDGAKRLADAVLLLLSETSCTIQITTAGLVPQNRELGLEFLARMEQLLEQQLKRLSVVLSFHLFHHLSKGEYLGCMKETIREFSRVFPDFGVDLLHNVHDRLQTEFLFLDIPTDLLLMQVSDRVLAIGRATRLSGAEIVRDCSYALSDLDELGTGFSISPRGIVSPYCGSFGASQGTKLGSVYKNDFGQIASNYERFLRAHKVRCAACPKGMSVCEFHRTARQQFHSRRSANPIVKTEKRLALAA